MEPGPGALVERFSWEIEARQRTDTDTEEFNQLRVDLVAERERRAIETRNNVQRIEAHFSATRSDDFTIFKKAKDELLRSMAGFQKLVPDHLKSNQLPTSWDDVQLAAAQVQAQWEAKAKEGHLGRAKGWIRKMCNGMNNHATALKMLPSDSEYVSLVAGSVSMIIKAAANHINVSEAFARGIVEINDAVKLEALSHVYDSPVLQQLTMRLYAQVFSYLIQFMTWFTDRSRTRFLKSFNENSLRMFEDELGQVKQISSLLSRQIQLHMSADVKVSKLLLEDLTSDIQYLLRFSEVGERQTRLRDAANAELLQNIFRSQFERASEEIRQSMIGMMNTYHERVRSEISGAGMTNLLEQQASAQIRSSPTPSSSTGHELASSQNADPPDDQGTKIAIQSGNNIMFESRHLENYFSWGHVHPPLPYTENPYALLAEATFVEKLDSFTTAMESRVLYAHVPYQTEGANPLLLSALGYISLARDAAVPVISYFCELSDDDPPPNRTRQSVELSALLYAMMRQIINLLPGDLSGLMPASPCSALSALDGTLRTWNEALALFEVLLSCVRLPVLIFVLDGLNELEDDLEHSTDEELESLVRCLCRLAAPSTAAQERMVKIMFTTSGLSEPLCRILDGREVVSCSNYSSRKARRPLQFLSF